MTTERSNYRTQLQIKLKIVSSGLLKKANYEIRLFELIQGCFQEKDILFELLPLSTPALLRAAQLILIKLYLAQRIFEGGQKCLSKM